MIQSDLVQLIPILESQASGAEAPSAEGAAAVLHETDLRACPADSRHVGAELHPTLKAALVPTTDTTIF